MMLRLDWSKAHLEAIQANAFTRWIRCPAKMRPLLEQAFFDTTSLRPQRKVEVVDPDEYIPPGRRAFHGEPWGEVIIA